MADSEKADSTLSVVSVVDIAAKAIAVLGAVCLMTGIVYNVSFFIFSKPEWLFHLTAADNLTATFYALPFVLLLIVAAAAYALVPIWLSEKGWEETDATPEQKRWAKLLRFLRLALFSTVALWLFKGWARDVLVVAVVAAVLTISNYLHAPIQTRVAVYASVAALFLL